ncbi:MAG: hypothetical protein ABH881_02945 [bacterium]
MFDDLTKKSNPPVASDNNSVAPKAPVPRPLFPKQEDKSFTETPFETETNRPMGAGQGHFVKEETHHPAVKSQPAPVTPPIDNAQSRKDLEDIFAEEGEPIVEKQKPAVFRSENRPTQIAETEEIPASGKMQKFVLLVILFLGLVGISAASYFGYKYFIGQEEIIIDSKDLNQNVVEEDKNITPKIEINSSDVEIDSTEPVESNLNEIGIEAENDFDQDGLSDRREEELGTDPFLIDTDHDDLFDLEEVTIYKTDPNNSDTDGDGYSDGEEVKNGYNPNGEGKLPQKLTP